LPRNITSAWNGLYGPGGAGRPRIAKFINRVSVTSSRTVSWGYIKECPKS
jgi:hypothetical protein